MLNVYAKRMWYTWFPSRNIWHSCIKSFFVVDIFTIAVIKFYMKKQNKQKPYRHTGYRRLTLKLFSLNLIYLSSKLNNTPFITPGAWATGICSKMYSFTLRCTIMYTILGYLYFVSANFHVCCAVYKFFSMAGLLFYFLLLTEHSMSLLQNNLIFQSLQVSGVINLSCTFNVRQWITYGYEKSDR